MYIINHGYILFVKKYVYALIGNPDLQNVTLTYNKYFFICDDMLYWILGTNQNNNIALNIIP